MIKIQFRSLPLRIFCPKKDSGTRLKVWGRGDGSGGNASDGELWGAADEASHHSPPAVQPGS